MFSARVVEVFVASPSDLPEEREAIRAALSDWNALNSESSACVLLPRSWETHSTPELGVRPQVSINSEVLQQADLVVCCFWTRFGTPTDDFQSGTVEELERSISVGKPVLLYFSDRPVVPGTVDPQQFAAVMDFKTSTLKRGLCGSFTTSADLRTQLMHDLTRVVRRLVPAQRAEAFTGGSILMGPNGERILETRDEVVQRARRSFARWSFEVIARWDSVTPEGWHRRSWVYDLERVWSNLSDAIAALAAALSYESSLVRYLREELSWFRRKLDGELSSLPDQYSRGGSDTDPEAVYQVISDYIQRARTLAELDWLAADR